MDVYHNTPHYSFDGADSRSADNQRTPLVASAGHQQQFQSALQTPSFTQDFLQNLIQQLVSQILNALSNQNSPQNQPQNQTQNQTPNPEPTTPSTDTGDALNLTSEQTKSLENYFDKGTSYYDGQVIDKDGSGTISAGDIAKLRQVSFASSSQYDYTLTQNDADIINNNNSPQNQTPSSDASTLTGTPNNDYIVGSPNRELLNGGAGDDYLNGGQGSDILQGGDGNDLLEDRDNNDQIYGGSGFDTLRVNGRLEDYVIDVKTVGTDNPEASGADTFFLSNRATGGEQRVNGVESFQFIDGTRSAEQLKSSFERLQKLSI